MAEIKNLTTLAQSVATAVNTTRDEAISAANEAVISEVRTTIVKEVINTEVGVDVSNLATKTEVSTAASTAATNLTNAVADLTTTIGNNKSAAETALSNYQNNMEDVVTGINTAIGEKGQEIVAVTGRVATVEDDIIQAKTDIINNASAIAGKVSTDDFNAYKDTVYTKAEIAELLGNEAGVAQVIGTYTKDKWMLTIRIAKVRQITCLLVKLTQLLSPLLRQK